MITVTFVPILAAGISSVVIAWTWYHSKVFGDAYTRLSGITPEVAERQKRKMPLMVIFAILASMLIAWVMTFVGLALNEFFDWIGAVELGFWIWLGFVAPILLGMVLWEGKSFKLYLIHAMYWLVSLVVMSLILLYGGTYFSGGATSYDSTGGGVQILD